LKPYARSALGRIASTGVARGLSVLVRKHPRAALHAAAAAIAAAGRVSWQEAQSKAAGLLGFTALSQPDGQERQAREISSGRPRQETSDPGYDPSHRDAIDAQELEPKLAPSPVPEREQASVASYPPELVEATRRKLEAEFDETELERARRLLDASRRRDPR